MNSKPITEQEFFNWLGAQIDADEDPIKAWRTFRSEYDQSILGGRNAQDREGNFMNRWETWKKYPTVRTMEIRQHRVDSFLHDLKEAYLMQPGIGEYDVEDWLKEVQRASSHTPSVVDALELLGEKNPDRAAELTERAKGIWPKLWEKNSDE